MRILLAVFALGLVMLDRALAVDVPKQVLVFSKSAGYEHAIVYRDTAWPSLLETELLKLGNDHHLFFTFSKEGAFLSPEEIAKYDAFVFYTSGNLLVEKRDGWGDNYSMMSPAGWAALHAAIRQGKGFMAVHSTIESFAGPVANGTNGTGITSGSQNILGAEYAGHGDLQKGRLLQLDKNFPGMAQVPADYQPLDQWYALQHFQPDLHVVLALDGAGMKGALYDRPPYPIAWARMEGKGRIFYTAMGHGAAIWKDPVFRQMILGGVQWVAGEVNARVTPNLMQVLPHANEIPPAARQTNIDSAELRRN